MMDKDALTAWALANGWTMIAGNPSLTKPSSPKEAIVRMLPTGILGRKMATQLRVFKGTEHGHART